MRAALAALATFATSAGLFTWVALASRQTWWSAQTDRVYLAGVLPVVACVALACSVLVYGVVRVGEGEE